MGGGGIIGSNFGSIIGSSIGSINGSSNGSGDFNDPVTNGSSSDYLSDLKLQLLKMTEMVKDKCQHIKIGV